jgi:hypothetical protein
MTFFAAGGRQQEQPPFNRPCDLRVLRSLRREACGRCGLKTASVFLTRGTGRATIDSF